MSIQADAVKAKIRQAFEGSVYPGDDNIVADGGHDPECKETAAAFKTKEWKSVSSDMVRDQKDALSLLTPAAFRYYFPAYLLACLEARNEIDVAWDSVIFDLTPPNQAEGPRRAFFLRRVEGFTALQAEAIRAFLELADEIEKADWASAGMQPPNDRLRAAIEYWTTRSMKH
jgi:hypothetical protein